MKEIKGLVCHDVDAHGIRIHVAEVGEGPLVPVSYTHLTLPTKA